MLEKTQVITVISYSEISCWKVGDDRWYIAQRSAFGYGWFYFRAGWHGCTFNLNERGQVVNWVFLSLTCVYRWLTDPHMIIQIVRTSFEIFIIDLLPGKIYRTYSMGNYLLPSSFRRLGRCRGPIHLHKKTKKKNPPPLFHCSPFLAYAERHTKYRHPLFTDMLRGNTRFLETS